MTSDKNPAFRPVYHYAPKQAWMNDPNGLVYYNNKWHLFYQYYNPEIIDGMMWGHAISDDLMHWNELPPALLPDEHGQIWSGSAVIDHTNSSGLFGSGSGMVCLFTYWDKSDFRQCQGLAYSEDGINFVKYQGNPVIPQLRYLDGHGDDKDFRDPKVFWHAQSGRWIMIVAGGKVRFFSSQDLIHWTFESINEEIITECPDLFELTVDNVPSLSKWVLSLGGHFYMLGSFDGHRFIPETEKKRMGSGPDFYATQTWDNVPDKRRISISWLYSWAFGNSSLKPTGIVYPFPTPSGGGCMTIPYEHRLIQKGTEIILTFTPVSEFDNLKKSVFSDTIVLTKNVPFKVTVPASSLEIDLEINLDSGSAGIRFPISNDQYTAGFDAGSSTLFIDRRASGIGYNEPFIKEYHSEAVTTDGKINLRILVDNCSLEMMTQDGSVMMSSFIMPVWKENTIELFTTSGKPAECAIKLFEIKI